MKNRFLQVPRPEMDKSLKRQEKGLSDDLEVLNKKVSSLFSRCRTGRLMPAAGKVSGERVQRSTGTIEGYSMSRSSRVMTITF